jgi:hypothetical protein
LWVRIPIAGAAEAGPDGHKRPRSPICHHPHPRGPSRRGTRRARSGIVRLNMASPYCYPHVQAQNKSHALIDNRIGNLVFLQARSANITRDATSSPGRRRHKQRQTMWTHAHLTRAISRLKHPRLAVGSRDRQATHPDGCRPVQG